MHPRSKDSILISSNEAAPSTHTLQQWRKEGGVDEREGGRGGCERRREGGGREGWV